MARLRTDRDRGEWSLESLHQLYDILTLQTGRIRQHTPGDRHRIRSLEDARRAWEACRDELMRMCQCHEQKPRCQDHELRYSPGQRPWGYWFFDLGLPAVPEDQRAELERLGFIGAEERRRLDDMDRERDKRPDI